MEQTTSLLLLALKNHLSDAVRNRQPRRFVFPFFFSFSFYRNPLFGCSGSSGGFFSFVSVRLPGDFLLKHIFSRSDRRPR